MLKILKMAEEKAIPVGFLGGQPQTLEKLVSRVNSDFPELKLVYKFSPSFKEITMEEDNRIVEEIRNSGARILFVGLGCPKQEYWMHAHRGKVNAVMLGVGAAFDFYTGTVNQAPVWMQRTGLEWFFRLTREPKRLWKRYFINNPRFVILAFIEQLHYLIGRKNNL